MPGTVVPAEGGDLITFTEIDGTERDGEERGDGRLEISAERRMGCLRGSVVCFGEFIGLQFELKPSQQRVNGGPT